VSTDVSEERWFVAQLNFSTLKMEAIYSSETSVDTQRITRRYIPDGGTLHSIFMSFVQSVRQVSNEVASDDGRNI
jgi:hypothetical protein